jgi:hypothetical protein
MRPLGFTDDITLVAISDTKFQALFFGIPDVIGLLSTFNLWQIYGYTVSKVSDLGNTWKETVV